MNIYFALSLLCFLGSLFLALFIKKIFKNSKNLNSIYLILAGVFLSVYILMLYVDYKPDVHGRFTTGFLALFHTIQVMLLGYDFEFLYASLSLSAPLSRLVYFYLSILFFVAPICTFGFVLSFFETIRTYIKYLFNRTQDVYVLSYLSDKSLTLAKTIREKFPKASVIFAISSKDENMLSYWKEHTDNINAIIINKNITDLKFKIQSKKTKITFFTIHEDETENINETLNIKNTLDLIERFRDRPNTEIYTFSNSKISEYLLDSVSQGNIKVKRINEVRSFVFSILENYDITETYTQKDGEKIISTLVVGFGKYGSEITKALLWCSQIPGYIPHINVIDEDSLTESEFTAECPEIMSKNNNTEVGEARYNLCFYNGINIHTEEFNKIVSNLTDTNVVYVSLGSDNLNIETAIKIRILLERKGVYPIIRAIVYDDSTCETLKKNGLSNHKKESYDIEIIGNISEMYSYDTIVNKKLYQLSLECHLRFSNTPEEREKATKLFNEYQYYRDSSAATAIYEKYRRKLTLSAEEMAVFEHMRWNAYMRTEGYIYSGSKSVETRNYRAKLHHNLHPYYELSFEDKEKDIIMTSVNKDE